MAFVHWWDDRDSGPTKHCDLTKMDHAKEGYKFHICCHSVGVPCDHPDVLAWGEENLTDDAIMVYTIDCCLVSCKNEADALMVKLRWS